MPGSGGDTPSLTSYQVQMAWPTHQEAAAAPSRTHPLRLRPSESRARAKHNAAPRPAAANCSRLPMAVRPGPPIGSNGMQAVATVATPANSSQGPAWRHVGTARFLAILAGWDATPVKRSRGRLNSGRRPRGGGTVRLQPRLATFHFPRRQG